MKVSKKSRLFNNLILTLIILPLQTISIISASSVENTFIITAESNDLPSELIAKMDSLGAQFHSVLDGVGVAIVTSDHPEFAEEIANIGGIRSVAPDIQIQGLNSNTKAQQFSYTNPPFSGDDDSFFDLQWGLDAINAIEAWNLGYRGSGALVAVLDNGFDLTHPDLQSQIDFTTSMSFVPEESLQFTGPGLCHGCHIAGIIAAADNGVGIIGVAPEAKLMLLKVLSDNGTTSFSWALDAIVYAANHGANIINMSFGIYLYSNDSYLDTINRVTEYAHKKGVTLIAAAGNDAFNRNSDPSIVLVPADASKVLSISATAPIGWAQSPLRTSFDNIASYSNYGDPYIDFAAPGGDTRYAGTDQSTVADVTSETSMFDLVISATNDGGWAFANGTSMAAAHASGIAALLIGKHGGFLDPELVECVLANSSEDLGAPGRDAFSGKGRLDAYRAVTYSV